VPCDRCDGSRSFDLGISQFVSTPNSLDVSLDKQSPRANPGALFDWTRGV